MRDVDLRIAEGVTLHVRYLVGEAVSARRGKPVALDDKTSYTIHVRSRRRGAPMHAARPSSRTRTAAGSRSGLLDDSAEKL